jgi:hypothetical protein
MSSHPQKKKTSISSAGSVLIEIPAVATWNFITGVVHGKILAFQEISPSKL